MRSEIEDQCSQTLSKSDEDTLKFCKESKVSYPRNLLISLSELDTCKRLPSGLKQSMLGELGTCATGLSHFCHNSDSARFHGYPSQLSHPNLECGLLGNGASPKITSCVSGASVPAVQGSGYYLLKRSNAAYRPPHFCKGKAHLRPEQKDFYNNETFGYSEHLSQERAEEERRRRDLFELMRKEQHKGFQRKQNKICDEDKVNLDPENGLRLEASGNSKWFTNKYNEPQECASSRSGTRDPSGHDVTTKTLGSAFPLPAILERRSPEMNFGTKFSAGTFISESCDTKRDHSKGYELHSSGLTHPFLGEKKPAGGVSSGYENGFFEVYTTQNEEVTEKISTNLSSSRNELTQNFLASIISLATDEMSEQLHEDFELSIPPDINESYSTNYSSVKGWSTDYKNRRYPNYSTEHGTSQYLSSEKKGLDKADMETPSKLNKGCLDKLCFSEIEGISKDLQTTEYSGIQRYPVGMITRNDILKPHGVLFLDGDNNNNNISSTVEKSGSIKLNCEGIMSSSGAKQTVVSKTEESISISFDKQTKVGFDLRIEPDCKLNHVSDFCENGDLVDEICLPDEDSLITVDDCILPQNSTSMAAGSSCKANLITSSSQVDIDDKLASLSPFPVDKRSTELVLEGPIFDSYDMVGLDTFRANLHNQQYYPQFGHYQMNPGKEICKSSYAQKVQISSRMRSSDSKTHHYYPQPLHYLPSNVLSDPFQHPHADLSWFGHSINSPLQKQMPVPNKFSSPHQVHGLPRGSPSPCPFLEMTYCAQESHPTQYFPFHYQQQNYRGHEMLTPGHIAGGAGNQAVRSKQMHPLAVAGPGLELVDKQVDKGFWYGQFGRI